MAIFALMSSRSIIRHLFAALLALVLIWIAARFLPSLPPPLSLVDKPVTEETEEVITPKDLRPDSLLAFFGGSLDRRKRGILPPGPPFPLYAFQINQYLETQRCRSLHFEEMSDTQLKLKYQCFSFEPHELTILKGGKLKPGTAQLYLLFETSAMTIPVLNGLNELQIAYSLLIDPATADSTFKFDLQRLKPEAIFLTLHHREMTRRAGEALDQTIQPQLNEDEVKERVVLNYKRYPEASGFMLSGKSLSFNYPHIANAVLGFIAEEELQLLLVSNQSTPTLDSACAKRAGTCLLGERTTDLQSIENALQNAATEARRRGSKILVLPLSLETLHAVEKLKEEAEKSGLEFLSLSKRIHINQAVEGDADEYNTGR